jgi:3-hydroxybutyryl-CoA dehydrogenase
LIPVVEMIAGQHTPADKLDAACALMTDIGKIPVRCKDVPGFIGNRLQHALWREAIALVQAGVCDAPTIDKVVKASFGRRLAVIGPSRTWTLSA